MDITTEMVVRLVGEQFPQWAGLDIRPVSRSGHDNRTFHLGREMTVRLPSGDAYVPQIEKEAKWLPYLSEHLTIAISRPIAQGKATCYYPFPWSVNQYIEGEPLLGIQTPDQSRIARELSAFLQELQRVPTEDGPAAGAHNFFRGSSPSVYGGQVEESLRTLGSVLPADRIRRIWAQAVASQWERAPVWLHGDIAPGNLLIKDGGLCGVIDFGIMGVGDPACDYAMAWTYFDNQARRIFLQGLDAGTVNRARGWALWKALLTYHAPDPVVSGNARYTVHVILDEYESITKEDAIG